MGNQKFENYYKVLFNYKKEAATHHKTLNNKFLLFM